MRPRVGVPRWPGASTGLALAQIVAFVLPENARSIAVLERLGMRRSPGLVRAFGLEVLRFGMQAGEFQPVGEASAPPSGGSSQ